MAQGGTQAYRALVFALAGEDAVAGDTLDRIVSEAWLDRQPGFRLIGTATAARAACPIGDARHASVFEGYLRPYAGVMASGGIVDVAAVDSLLGGLAALQGRYDEADGLFGTGLELEERFGAPVFAAQTRYSWPRCLQARGGPGDEDRATELLDADRLDMAQVAAWARS